MPCMTECTWLSVDQISVIENFDTKLGFAGVTRGIRVNHNNGGKSVESKFNIAEITKGTLPS